MDNNFIIKLNIQIILLQILRNVVRAVLYSRCIPNGICYVLIGAFFVWRGVQAIVYLIIEKVASYK